MTGMDYARRNQLRHARRIRSLEFAPTETSFETCPVFSEVYADGTRSVAMSNFRLLPLSTQDLLNEAVRTRLLLPGTLNTLVINAKENGDTEVSEQKAFRIEGFLLAARGLSCLYPETLTGEAGVTYKAIDLALTGLRFNRLVKNRVPIRGSLTDSQINTAVALAFMTLTGSPDDFNYGRNPAVHVKEFTDADGSKHRGTIMRNHELGRIIRERPETAERIFSYLTERGPIGSTKVDAQPVIAYLDSGVHSAVSEGWL